MTKGQEPDSALFVVSTPIGNLGDISARAIAVLGMADLVACEDTRRTGSLLAAIGVTGAKLMRLDAHTEASRAAEVIERLRQGQRVAVVTDAGTPGVSDPGSYLVGACIDEGLRVVPVPGPSAALAALVASGLPTDRFTVDGFLPRKGSNRALLLAEIAGRQVTTVLYESPNRLAATLVDLAAVCGERRTAVVARELTKLHEEILRASLGELADRFSDGTRGEVVIVVSPAAPVVVDDEAISAALLVRSEEGLSRSAAVATVTSDLGVQKRRVYDVALAMEWPSARP